MTYSKWNSYLGWLIFAISSAVYLMTIESTASLWDCDEYITAAYKLEVGHPPGAPLFMVLGRLFSFFAAVAKVCTRSKLSDSRNYFSSQFQTVKWEFLRFTRGS